MTEELATFVCDQLQGDRVRPMFGGWGIYRDSEMVAIVHDGRAFMKATSEASQARYQAEGMGPFQPRPTQTLRSFWEIPPHVLEDAPTLRAWLSGA